MSGISASKGTRSCTSLIESWISPPRTAIWPLLIFIIDSISRVCTSGIRLTIGWQAAAAVGEAPQGLASEGFGSLTKLMMRETLGLTLRSTVSLSLICGVTFMTKPTGTTFGVVVNAVVTTVWVAVWFACTVKYTRLSTTFRMAVWLLITESLGLDSTRT